MTPLVPFKLFVAVPTQTMSILINCIFT